VSGVVKPELLCLPSHRARHRCGTLRARSLASYRSGAGRRRPPFFIIALIVNALWIATLGYALARLI
jgi:hypothetical protein